MSRVLGLTGSIGMGKSTVAAMFRRLGVPVFDADAEVHVMQARGGRLVDAIDRLFPGTAGADGVDRVALGRAVFGNGDALRRLEALIHPEVDRARRGFLRRHRAHPLVVVDIPLLFEKGGWRQVDMIAVASAPAWKQRARVMARPGMRWARLKQIKALQTPDAVKRRRADIVIPTGVTIGATSATIRRITACLRARAKR
jgi:dephospho-CoA kinase